MQIRDLLKKGMDSLHGRDSASLDAEVLLAYALGVDKEYLFSRGDEEIDSFTVALYNKYIRRVAKGEPVAYILGKKEFYGLNFFVDERVLVPRPETEHLVDEALQYLKGNDENGRRFRILDVGTGSGNIAVSVAKGFFDLGSEGVLEQVDAIDISEAACEVAKVNVGQHGFDEIIHVYQSDLLDAIEEGERFDVVVANLPYIGEFKNRYVTDDVENHEPGEALFGGEDGLELYKKMFQQIAGKGVGCDVVIGEFCFGQAENMKSLLNSFFDQRWSIKKDNAGIDRIFIVNR